MCGGNPIRDIFRALQTVQPKPVIQERSPTAGAAIKPQPCIYCGQILPPGYSDTTACPSCGAPRARRSI